MDVKKLLSYILAVIVAAGVTHFITDAVSRQARDGTDENKSLIEAVATDTAVVRGYNRKMIDTLRKTLKRMNVAHVDLVIAQAILETGNFTSPIFMENNNLFGMRVPIHRPHVVIGERRGHAVYAGWRESMEDYALYQAWCRRGVSEDDYYKLFRHYAEAKTYASKIKIIVGTLRTNYKDEYD